MSNEQESQVKGEGDPAARSNAARGSVSREELYKQSDDAIEASGDFEDVPDEAHDTLTEVPDQETEVTEQAKTPSTSVPEKRKIKVNGQEVEYSLADLDALVSKGLAADQRFEEAARLKREVEAKITQPPAKADVETPQVTDDDLALARALQMGSEEEAAKVVNKLRSRPTLTEDAVTKKVDERLAFNSSVERFKSKFPDIFKDQNLVDLVMQKDAAMVARGDNRPYDQRYDEIGTEITKWLGTYKGVQTTEDKLKRKASITVLPAASARAGGEAEEEGEENPSDVIGNMAKARGQPMVQRGTGVRGGR